MIEKLHAVAAESKMYFARKRGDYIVFGYHYFDPAEFRELCARYGRDVMVEIRGFMVNARTGQRIYSMPKFFNIGEDIITPSFLSERKIVSVYEKLDGSLIKIFREEDSGRIVITSKHSFDCDLVDESRRILDNDPALSSFIHDEARDGRTILLELVSPSFPIVVNYDSPRLVPLAIRDRNGNFLDIAITPRKFEFSSFDEIERYLSDIENFEGFVVHLDNGTMVKVKSRWYIERHGYATLSRGDMLAIVKENRMDDVLPYMPAARASMLEKMGRDYFRVLSALHDMTMRCRAEYPTPRDLGLSSEPFKNMIFPAFRAPTDEDVMPVLVETMKRLSLKKFDGIVARMAFQSRPGLPGGGSERNEFC